jgi:hypothetical protein
VSYDTIFIIIIVKKLYVCIVHTYVPIDLPNIFEKRHTVSKIKILQILSHTYVHIALETMKKGSMFF